MTPSSEHASSASPDDPLPEPDRERPSEKEEDLMDEVPRELSPKEMRRMQIRTWDDPYPEEEV